MVPAPISVTKTVPSRVTHTSRGAESGVPSTSQERSGPASAPGHARRGPASASTASERLVSTTSAGTAPGIGVEPEHAASSAQRAARSDGRVVGGR